MDLDLHGSKYFEPKCEIKAILSDLIKTKLTNDSF